MTAPVTVLASTFEDLVTIGLRQIISEDTNLHLIGDNVPLEGLEQAIAEHQPSVVLLNFGSLPSPAYVYQLHQQAPATRIVVLANRPTAAECNQLLSFGATACVSKETQGRDIINALHLASRGMHVMPRSAAASAGPSAERLDMPEPDLLTAREADVLELLQQGFTNAEIAHDLSIGIETVRTHARNIYRKLGISTRRDLARLTRPENGAGPAPGPAPGPASGAAGPAGVASAG
jgi:DNA-binding NarL/FixJ family response regulator